MRLQMTEHFCHLFISVSCRKCVFLYRYTFQSNAPVTSDHQYFERLEVLRKKRQWKIQCLHSMDRCIEEQNSVGAISVYF